jgi:hypothetical protein
MGATGEPTGRKRDDPFTRLHRLEVLGQIANLLVAVAITLVVVMVIAAAVFR